jgi:hypothetical protein
VVARAQQGNRVRRIGVLMPFGENDPQPKRRISAFIQALENFGWTDGRRVRLDLRWTGGDNDRTRALAQELVGLQSDHHLQAIANTAAFHFATIEQGGTSLYRSLAQRVTRVECCAFFSASAPPRPFTSRPGGTRQATSSR